MKVIQEFLAQSITPIDLIMLCLALYFGIRGFLLGFAREFASLAGTLIGAWLAFTQWRWLADILSHTFPRVFTNPVLTQMTAIVLLFLASGLICSLLGRLLACIFRFVWLNFFNRVLGLALGLGKTIIIAMVIVHFRHLIPGWHIEGTYPWKVASWALTWLENNFPTLLG